MSAAKIVFNLASLAASLFAWAIIAEEPSVPRAIVFTLGWATGALLSAALHGVKGGAQ